MQVEGILKTHYLHLGLDVGEDFRCNVQHHAKTLNFDVAHPQDPRRTLWFSSSPRPP